MFNFIKNVQSICISGSNLSQYLQVNIYNCATKMLNLKVYECTFTGTDKAPTHPHTDKTNTHTDKHTQHNHTHRIKQTHTRSADKHTQHNHTHTDKHTHNR